MKSGLFKYNKEFVLESGEKLPRYQLQYTTYGELNENKDNVIWVCHALTASSEVHSWWEGMIGDGLTLDTSKYFVICANILGSCYGSTCPLETNPNQLDRDEDGIARRRYTGTNGTARRVQRG